MISQRRIPVEPHQTGRAAKGGLGLFLLGACLAAGLIAGLATATASPAPSTPTTTASSPVVHPSAAPRPEITTTTSTTLRNPWTGPQRPPDSPPMDVQLAHGCPKIGVVVVTHSAVTPTSKTISVQTYFCSLAQPGWTYTPPKITTITTLPKVVYTNQTCWAPAKLTYPGEPTQTGVDTSKEICW